MLQVSIRSVAPPTICSPCPRCRSREFACSHRFRVNTNGKVADVWLIYRCIECEATKNVAIVERTPVARIDRVLFDAATVNDPVVARRLARDATILRRAGVQLARGDVISVDNTGVSDPRFRLAFQRPLVVRLGDVLSVVTGTPRSRLRAMERDSRLVLDPPRPLARLALIGDTTVAFRV